MNSFVCIFFLVTLLVAGLHAQCESEPFSDSLVGIRGSDAGVIGIPGDYNYVPTILYDGSYRVWWCSGGQDHPGDSIFYAESPNMTGGFEPRAGQPLPYVFRSTGNPATFDAVHTCDPSMLRVNGIYYMYYGGNSDSNIYPDSPGNPYFTTMIGVAQSSDDGMTWTRLNNGNPIVIPQWANLVNLYGAGQPSVVYKDDFYYMLYTDTTGTASTGAMGANVLYVTRARDPAFQIGREVLSATGFIPYSFRSQTSFGFMQGASIDWVFSDQRNQWIVALDGPSNTATVLYFWSEDLSTLYGTLNVPGTWTEGPGIVSRPDHHAVADGANPALVPIDLFRSAGQPAPNVLTWELAHIGADVLQSGNPKIQYSSVFDGSILDAAGLPPALIVEGVRIQFELAAPMMDITRTQYSVGSNVFYGIPYGASVYTGNTVLSAPNRIDALLLDDGNLWPVTCAKFIVDNKSTPTVVTTAYYDSFMQGPTLYCITGL